MVQDVTPPANLDFPTWPLPRWDPGRRGAAVPRRQTAPSPLTHESHPSLLESQELLPDVNSFGCAYAGFVGEVFQPSVILFSPFISNPQLSLQSCKH